MSFFGQVSRYDSNYTCPWELISAEHRAKGIERLTFIILSQVPYLCAVHRCFI